MARSKLFVSLLAVIGVCVLAGTSFAKKTACPFKGNYAFFFWDPAADMSGVGYVSVRPTVGTSCRAGTVLPGGIINCRVDADEYETFIEDGAVYLETDGAGTMEIETNSSGGICGTGDNAIELDVSVASNGAAVLFNGNGVKNVSSGTIPQAALYITGRMAKCYSADLVSGSYDFHFWSYEGLVGDCDVDVNGAGLVTGGSCHCFAGVSEYLSEIESGTYTPGESCQSSTGYMMFTTSSDNVCGQASSTVILDYAVAAGGTQILIGCDPGNKFNCSGEGYSSM